MINKEEQATSSRRADYAGWRGQLLAQLALSRLRRLTVYAGPLQGRYDFLAMADEVVSFFVKVKAFSSMKRRVHGIESVQQLRWRIPTRLILDAHKSQIPVVLFLFDADTGHGRYLRLDTIKVTMPGAVLQTVRLPVGNTISEKGLSLLIEELGAMHTAAHASQTKRNALRAKARQ